MTETLNRTRPAPPETESSVSRRSLVVLAVILTGQFMSVMDSSIVNVAIPAMRSSLHANGSELQLIVSGYVIAYAVLLVTGARLGDKFGQRTMYVAGIAAFTLASLACGLAWNPLSLIIFRFLQGAAAAAGVPQVMTMIQRTFTGRTRGLALSAYGTVISGGVIVGQVAGGIIVDADLAGSSWRGVFLVNVPIGLVLVAAAPRVLPRIAAGAARALDLPGLTALTGAVLLMVLPLVLGHQQNWPLWTWLALAGSAAAFAAFGLIERMVHHRGGAPLFADAVLRTPGLLLTAATLLLTMTTFAGFQFVLAMHMQGPLGYSALRAGLLYVPCGLTFGAASMNWQKLPVRMQAAAPAVGLFVAALCSLAMGVLLYRGDGVGLLVLTLFGLVGLGNGFAFSPLMTRATSRVPITLAADASGILVTGAQLGVVIGVAAFGSVYFSVAGATMTSLIHAVGVTVIATGVTALAAAVMAVRAAR
ncbi:MFS transporter [Nocardia stercoris]|uniref:MFS transporter n=1 Tax=Nocardia stercoris TaxID=2483361 RepID=A0A3M2L6V9_9NOCA|nr:MFS transporter [Nocardia stercoris]RMI32726.1 MFS transporter [Nocardia stercoris]